MDLQALKNKCQEIIKAKSAQVPRNSEDEGAWEYIGELEHISEQVKKAISVEDVKEIIGAYIKYSDVGL